MISIFETRILLCSRRKIWSRPTKLYILDVRTTISSRRTPGAVNPGSLSVGTPRGNMRLKSVRVVWRFTGLGPALDCMYDTSACLNAHAASLLSMSTYNPIIGSKVRAGLLLSFPSKITQCPPDAGEEEKSARTTATSLTHIDNPPRRPSRRLIRISRTAIRRPLQQHPLHRIRDLLSYILRRGVPNVAVQRVGEFVRRIIRSAGVGQWRVEVHGIVRAEAAHAGRRRVLQVQVDGGDRWRGCTWFKGRKRLAREEGTKAVRGIVGKGCREAKKEETELVGC